LFILTNPEDVCMCFILTRYANWRWVA